MSETPMSETITINGMTGRRLIEARVMAEHRGVFDMPAEWDEERVSRHLFRLLVEWADDWDYEDDTIDDDGVRRLREHSPHTIIYVVGEGGGVDKSLGWGEWDGWRAEKAAEAWESLTEEERRAIRLRPTSGQLDIFGGEVQ